MSSTIRIIAIPGSLRKGSYNRAALMAASELAPKGVDIEIRDLDGIPFFNADDEKATGFPSAVLALREAVAGADALLLATPEYNSSTTGVLKNTLDWLSRGGSESVLRDKPTAILGAAGRFGSLRAQLHLREILTSSGSDLVVSPQVMIDAAPTRFDDDLRLTGDRYRDQVARLVAALADKVVSQR